jgi:hypothetical protein
MAKPDSCIRMTSLPPLTILAMPKPFRGHIGIIQRNAK